MKICDEHPSYNGLMYPFHGCDVCLDFYKACDQHWESLDVRAKDRFRQMARECGFEKSSLLLAYLHHLGKS